LGKPSRLAAHWLDNEHALGVDRPCEFGVMAEAHWLWRFGTSPRFQAIGTWLWLSGFAGSFKQLRHWGAEQSVEHARVVSAFSH
jgi:hypothetical protein